MDRRTFTAMVLTMLVLFVWTSYKKANQETPPEGEVNEASTDGSGSLDVLAFEPDAGSVTEPIAEPFTAPVDENIPVKDVVFTGCGAEGTFNTATGSMRSLQVSDWEGPQDARPLWSEVYSGAVFEEGYSWNPYGGDPGVETLAGARGQLLTMGSGKLDSDSPRTEIIEQTANVLVLRGTTADGIEVTRKLTVRDADPCAYDIELTWTNRTTSPYSEGLWVGMHDWMTGSAGYYGNLVRPYAMFDGDVEWLADVSDLDEGPQSREGAVSWLALADRYFAAALIPADDSTGRIYFSKRADPLPPVPTVGDEEPRGSALYGGQIVLGTTLAAGASHTESFKFYVGPLDYNTMTAVDEDLGYFVKWNYGWFALFCFPLLWLLNFFHGLVGNWGLAIIALTVTMKGVFFPLTQASFKSGQAMQAIQPQLQEVREKYKDEPEKLNQATIDLFKENGVNPLGGCLPMLVQMPVWFALYRVLLSSVDLYHTDFLYLQDLSVTDPYMALPIIVIVAMLAQQSMMPTANMDPQQARMLKLMPLIFGFFFFTFPAGLVLYIFVNMILTILQQWLIRRQFKLPEGPKGTAVAATT